MVAGLHIVRKLRRGKPAVWYVYAWRGGPRILRAEGQRPKITAALTDAAAEKRRELPAVTVETIDSLIEQFRRSAEWGRVSKATKVNYGTWLDRISTRFGKTPLGVFTDRRVRQDVLEWRDQWAHQPRSADAAITCFTRLLSWAHDRGKLPPSVLTGIDRLYEADRSDVIWEAPDFAAFMPHASVEIQEAVELASLTGLRRGDLIRLPWSAVGEHAILWKTGKSKGKATARVPMMEETKALLQRIRDRHLAAMEAKRPDRRKPLPDTILSNSHWQPWTPSGFGSRFNDAKTASKVERNFHDLRGTFATRCMLAGLNDQEIADILGWKTVEVAAIRVKYVDQTRVVIELGKRIAAAKV